MTYDYQIRVLDDLPVNEAVTENEDGSYTIFVNGNLCQDKQRQVVEHALGHIQNEDFDSDDDVQAIEARAHGRK